MSQDEAAIGAVIDEMYAMISGPAGPRDWSRQQVLFHPQSRQMRITVDAAGTPAIRIMAPDAYAADVAPFFAANAFYEVETARRIDVLGRMAHAWSVYEARTHPDDPEPERRGVNSIQLYKGESGAWRIMSMIWDNEREGVRVAPL